MQSSELKNRVQSIYRASQSSASGLSAYYMCPVNKVRNIVELAYVAYALSLQPNCTTSQKTTLKAAMQAMYKRGVYAITGSQNQINFANQLLAASYSRPSEETASKAFFGPNFKSRHLRNV